MFRGGPSGPSAGDVDGDGHPDLAVSAWALGRDEGGQTGWVDVFATGGSGPTSAR